MLYFKQILEYHLSPWSVNWLLTDIPGDNRLLPILSSRNVYKKCNYGRNQYLFVYRLALLKIIEILDCVLKDNQKEFIPPFKNIHFYYPVLLFVYSDIGLGRMKFLINQTIKEVNFSEFESLAGDEKSLVRKWEELRPKYLNYRGEIENLYAMNGLKEHKIPVRLKIILEQVDEILENQKSQYSPIKVNGIQLKGNVFSYKEKEIRFKKDGKRLKIIRLLINNPTGISSVKIREKVSLVYGPFKTIIQQINRRIEKKNLRIKYDKTKKVYLLTTNK